MTAFLSEPWIALLDQAVRDLPPPTAALVVEQVVIGEPPVRYHLVLDPAGCRVLAGAATDADIELEVDVPTAARLARGEENAQRALSEGRLKVRGRLERLAELGDFLTRLDDVYAAVRDVTEFPDD